jgi:hypothetical protein
LKHERHIFLVWFCLILASCSIEDKGIRTIRGHSLDKQGIAHGASALRAERYCQYCHGKKLLGGLHGEPSCYQCHGQRWIAYEPELILAPTTHTLDRGGFLHHEAISEVPTTCNACHGSELQGLGWSGAPSCVLCHDELWLP